MNQCSCRLSTDEIISSGFFWAILEISYFKISIYENLKRTSLLFLLSLQRVFEVNLAQWTEERTTMEVNSTEICKGVVLEYYWILSILLWCSLWNLIALCTRNMNSYLKSIWLCYAGAQSKLLFLNRLYARYVNDIRTRIWFQWPANKFSHFL